MEIIPLEKEFFCHSAVCSKNSTIVMLAFSLHLYMLCVLHKWNALVWINWSGNKFPSSIRLKIKRPCSRINFKTDLWDSIQYYRTVHSLLDVTNANLFEHYLNVLFMNLGGSLAIKYIYSPSVVLSAGPRIDNKSFASIFNLSLFTPVINISNCHT